MDTQWTPNLPSIEVSAGEEEHPVILQIVSIDQVEIACVFAMNASYDSGAIKGDHFVALLALVTLEIVGVRNARYDVLLVNIAMPVEPVHAALRVDGVEQCLIFVSLFDVEHIDEAIGTAGAEEIGICCMETN